MLPTAPLLLSGCGNRSGEAGLRVINGTPGAFETLTVASGGDTALVEGLESAGSRTLDLPVTGSAPLNARWTGPSGACSLSVRLLDSADAAVGVTLSIRGPGSGEVSYRFR